MAQQGDVTLKISADLAEFKASMQAASAEIRKFADTAKASGTGDLGFGRVKDGVNSAVSAVKNFAATLATVYAAGQLLKLADDVSLVNARLRLAVGGVKDFADAQAFAYRVSQQTGAGYEAIANLYARLSLTAKDYGLSQQQIVNVTESTALALRVSGSSAAESASVITQLSQALGSGVLRGEEFNAIMENGGRLAKALADGLGLPIGKLRDLSKTGALTTEIVAGALETQRSVLEQEAAQMPRTVEAALSGVKDQFGKFANELSQSAGATSGVAAAFDALGRNIKDVVGTAAVAAIGAMTVAMNRAAASSIDYVKAKLAEVAAERQKVIALQQSAAAEVVASQSALRAAVAQEAAAAAALAEAKALQADVVALGIYGERRAAANRQVAAAAAAHTAATATITAAQTRLATAQGVAAASMATTGIAARALSGAIGFLGGPIGLITTALTVGATAWSIWGGSAKTASDEAKGAIERALDAVKRLKKEEQYGTGDLAALREARDILEQRIQLQAQSSGASQGARDELAAKRQQLADIEDQIAKAESREANMAGGGATALGRQVLEKNMDEWLKKFRDKQSEMSDAIAEFKKMAVDLAKAGDAGYAEGGAKFNAGIKAIKTKFRESNILPDLNKQLDESFRLTKDALDRESRALDQALEDRKISVSEWYAQKTSISESNYQNEKKRLEKERDLYVQQLSRGQTAAAGAGTAEERKSAERDVVKAKNDVAKVDADLIILERERAKTVKDIARDTEKYTKEYSRSLGDLKIQLSRARGDDLQATLSEIDQAYADAKEKFKQDPTALDLVDRLFSAEKLKARFADLQTKFDAIQSRYSQQGQQIENGVSSGALSSDMAQQAQSENRQRTVAELQAVAAAMQQVAAESNNPAIIEGAQRAMTAVQTIAQQSLTGIAGAIAELRVQLKNLQDSFAKTVASSAVDSLTNFFTDLASGTKSAGDALKDFVRSFAQSMAQIAARAIATFIVLQALDTVYPGLGKTVSATMGAGVKHRGGMVGTGPVRQVNPLIFAGAPRYHSGGVVGLKSDEVPAILQKGEEVLAKNDPRNAANGGGQGGGVRVINVIDPNMVGDYMSSSAGERAVLNVLQRNSGAVKQVLA